MSVWCSNVCDGLHIGELGAVPVDEHREYVAVVCFRNCCVAGDFNQQIECVCGRSVSVVCSIPFDDVDTASCGQDDESLPDSRTVDAAITHSTDPVPEKDEECDCEDCDCKKCATKIYGRVYLNA